MRRLAAAAAIGLFCTAAAGAAANSPRVLFDQAHGQRFLVEGDGALDLSQLGEVLRRAGAQVGSSSVPFTPETLAGSDVVVISGAFVPLAPAERQALLAFLEGGGKLAVMLHIGQPVAELLAELGVAISNGVIRESDGVLHGNQIDFRVSRLARHPITDGLTGFALYGAWALLAETAQVIALAETQPHSWVDLNHSDRYDTGDAMQSFAVAVAGERGGGRFVVFGDDAMFQNQFLAAGQENRKLARNLAQWLLGKESGAFALTATWSPILYAGR